MTFKHRVATHKTSLVVLLVIIVFFQWINSRLTMPQIPLWYNGLQHPAWTPPAWVFGPVWTVLYLMIWFSGWLIWSSLDGTAREKWQHPVVRLFALQLALNFLWTPLFFHFHLMGVALVEISLLACVLLSTIRHARNVHRAAAWLLVPYLLWVCYALTLNAGFFYLNG